MLYEKQVFCLLAATGISPYGIDNVHPSSQRFDNYQIFIRLDRIISFVQDLFQLSNLK